MDNKEKYCGPVSRAEEIIKSSSGSSTLEFVYAAAALVFLIISCMMLLTYVLEYNTVSYAAKRMTRYIEVSGEVNTSDLNQLLDELLHSKDAIGATWTVAPDGGYVRGNKIQLRDRFTLTLKGTYNINIAMLDGAQSVYQLHLPITVRIRGESEVFHKT